MKTIFVLSDIHLGAGLASDWYKKDKHDTNLIKMIKDIAKEGQNNKVDLVLAGDIFDTWLTPMNKKPNTIQEILENNENIVKALSDCLKTTDIYYINGNHDMNVSAKDLDFIHFDDKKIKCIKEYRSGLVKIEHGHNYAMFNARDLINDPLHGLPTGYFITRMLAGNRDYKSQEAYISYIDDLLESAFTTQTITSSLIEAVMEFTSHRPSDHFIMPYDRPSITIKEVKEKYKNVFKQWVRKYGYWYSLNAIRAELGSLNWFADRLSQKHDYKIVVMGHSHSSEIDKDGFKFLDNNSIYANAGHWTTSKPSYIKIVKDKGYKVSLYKKNKEGFKVKSHKI